jgi:hypothetical protein
MAGTAWIGTRRIGPTLPPNDSLYRELVHIGMHIPQGHAPRAMLVPGQVLAETQPRKRRTCPPDEGLNPARNRPGTTVTSAGWGPSAPPFPTAEPRTPCSGHRLEAGRSSPHTSSDRSSPRDPRTWWRTNVSGVSELPEVARTLPCRGRDTQGSWAGGAPRGDPEPETLSVMRSSRAVTAGHPVTKPLRSPPGRPQGRLRGGARGTVHLRCLPVAPTGKARELRITKRRCRTQQSGAGPARRGRDRPRVRTERRAKSPERSRQRRSYALSRAGRRSPP